MRYVYDDCSTPKTIAFNFIILAMGIVFADGIRSCGG